MFADLATGRRKEVEGVIVACTATWP